MNNSTAEKVGDIITRDGVNFIAADLESNMLVCSGCEFEFKASLCSGSGCSTANVIFKKTDKLTSVQDSKHDELVAKAKLWLEANVWDGEDRSGCKDDFVRFNPDELLDLASDMLEEIIKMKSSSGHNTPLGSVVQVLKSVARFHNGDFENMGVGFDHSVAVRKLNEAQEVIENEILQSRS